MLLETGCFVISARPVEHILKFFFKIMWGVCFSYICSKNFIKPSKPNAFVTVLMLQRWIKWKLKNVNKTSERTDRNPLAVPPIRTKVIATIMKQQAENSTCQYGKYIATIVEVHSSKKEVHSVIKFLSSKGLNPLDIHCEVCTVYGHKCVCKAEVYNWVIKFKTDITSLHDTDHLQQAYKRYGTPVTKKSG